MDCQQIISALALRPHPEGGFYRETFRDKDPPGARSHSTAIYFLLRGGETSRWHRVDSVEIFHYYAGAPLELRTQRADNAEIICSILGPNLLGGERPQAIVEGGVWQSARSLGEYSLVGCTVSPGFEFAHFEMKAIEP